MRQTSPNLNKFHRRSNTINRHVPPTPAEPRNLPLGVPSAVLFNELYGPVTIVISIKKRPPLLVTNGLQHG
jgi:hypothetical protein